MAYAPRDAYPRRVTDPRGQLADLGWGVGQLKVGSFARGERMVKWNEALRIEEMLGADARFAGRDALPLKKS